MKKYQFQKRILLRSIFIMLILFIILTMVFSSYVIKTSTAEFEEQIDVQLRGITTQIDNTLRLADDIALQIAANYQIIDAFSGLQEYHDEKNYFVENTDVDYTIKQHLISYMLKQNILKRISLFNSNQDITYVGKAVDFGYLKKDCPNPDIFTDTQSYFADQKGKGSLFRVDSSDPYMREISPTISVLREIKNYQLIPSECLGYAQVQIQIDSFARLGKLLGKETECFVLDQKNDHVLYSFQSNRKESEIKTLLRQTNNLQGGLYCKLWDSEKYGIKVLIVSKNTGLIHSLMSTFTWGIFLLFSLITIMILAQKIKLYPGNREFFEVEEDIQFILENYYSEKELLKEFNFLLKDIFGIAMYDSGDKKIIALKIKNYLDEMFRTNITNQLLAARFGFVPSYIVSIFKTYYGLTPMDYLVKTRIDESKFLLTNSSLKIKEVANEVGYEDSLYFSKVFKKITGVSPKEYIRSEKIDS